MGRLKKNFIANVYNSTAGVVGQLLVVPVYLHYWGTELYGAWLVLFTIPTLLKFADVGLANAVGNEVSLSIEQGDAKRAERTFNAAWKFQALLFLVLYSVLAAAVWFLPVEQWLCVQMIAPADLRLSVLLLAAATFFLLQRGILSALFRGARRYHEYIMWSAHASVLETLTIIVLLSGGAGVGGVSAAILGLQSLLVALLFRRGKSALPFLDITIRKGRWRDFRRVLPVAASYFSFPAANAIINQGTTLAVNHFFGPSSVVILSVTRQLARLFNRGTGLLMGTLHPEMTVALGTRDRKRVVELQGVGVALPLIVAAGFVPVVSLAGPALIVFWTQKNMEISHLFALACALEAVAFSCKPLFSLVLWASNQISKLSFLNMFGDVAAYSCAVYFANSSGLIIFPVAFGVSAVIYCVVALCLGTRKGAFSFFEILQARYLMRHISRCFATTMVRRCLASGGSISAIKEK